MRNKSLKIIGKLVWLHVFFFFRSSGVFGDEFTQYRDCAISNATTWRQFDLLMNIDSFTPDDKSGIVITRQIRLAVDFDSKQLFCTDLSSKRWDQKRQTIGSAAYVNGAAAHIMRFPGDGQDLVPDIERVLLGMDIPDLRAVGVLDFPTDFEHDDSSTMTFNSVVKRRNNPATLDAEKLPVVREVSTPYEIRFTRKVDRAKVLIGNSFNPVTLMPRSMLVTGNREPVSLPVVDEYYEWKEMDGIYVPVSVVHESGGSQLVVGDDGKKVQKRTLRVKHASIHWFSLNKQIDQALLDPALIHDIGKLNKLVDPAATGAFAE